MKNFPFTCRNNHCWDTKVDSSWRSTWFLFIKKIRATWYRFSLITLN